ncbi:hypothetical protein BDV95DRAFT_664961 [Massariosphaeria phaeospora]|uniref:Uncharacterized protein n=1 Tax=Massariosphaeria phaeospora TaxID=100035 RepID=A0A7C8MF68_9PLEO|nr:hypothetical protein BDV95DRAFT_664961 [Massariosphaeria phaeospora]
MATTFVPPASPTRRAPTTPVRPMSAISQRASIRQVTPSPPATPLKYSGFNPAERQSHQPFTPVRISGPATPSAGGEQIELREFASPAKKPIFSTPGRDHMERKKKNLLGFRKAEEGPFDRVTGVEELAEQRRRVSDLRPVERGSGGGGGQEKWCCCVVM